VCIVLIKDKNCNTVCTSPEGGMDIQIKTLHRCMNEYNSSPQWNSHISVAFEDGMLIQIYTYGKYVKKTTTQISKHPIM
jgi:aspartate/tyrosine/aromatic aminotransferase